MLIKNPSKSDAGAFHQPEYPVIGSKYKGPNTFNDTLNGVSWCVSQRLTEGESRVQGSLLANHKKLKPLKVDPRMVLPKDPPFIF